MNGLWTSLVPLIVGSAIVPIQIVVTILLLRRSRLTALAWVAGMSTVRAAQGVFFGLVLSSSDAAAADTGDGGGGLVVSTLLLVVAVLFLVTAVRQLLGEDDPDAPPPKWMAMVDKITPLKAFLIGAGLLVVGAKFWVFTLSALAVIGDTDLGQPGATISFVLFIVLAESIHLALIGISFAMPSKSEAILDSTSQWLSSHNRIIMIVLGSVFGTWFMVKALDGFGVI